MTQRNLLFLLFNALMIMIFYAPLKTLFSSSWQESVYSHIMLIPFVSGYLLFSERKSVFTEVGYSSWHGSPVILIGALLYVIAKTFGASLNENDSMSLLIASTVIIWIGGFVLLYGRNAFMKARFSLLFLLLMVPVPSTILDKIVFLMQKLSADMANIFFMISGVPYYRTDLQFNFSQLTIEVAEQCSGIRSSIALFVASILTGYLFLKTTWRKVVLTLIVFPICIVRNGLRIAMLSLLGNYIDVNILSSSLHKQGGIPLFVFSFVFLMIICWIMRRSEKKELLRKKTTITPLVNKT